MSLVSVGKLENTEVSSSDYPFKSVCLPFTLLNCALFPYPVLIKRYETVIVSPMGMNDNQISAGLGYNEFHVPQWVGS